MLSICTIQHLGFILWIILFDNPYIELLVIYAVIVGCFFLYTIFWKTFATNLHMWYKILIYYCWCNLFSNVSIVLCHRNYLALCRNPSASHRIYRSVFMKGFFNVCQISSERIWRLRTASKTRGLQSVYVSGCNR